MAEQTISRRETAKGAMDLDIVASVEQLRLPVGKFWFLASPYSKRDLDGAAEEAMDVSSDLEFLRIPHFAPIPSSHDLARIAGVDPRDHEFWEKINLPWMHASHGCLVLMMDGWDQSVGIDRERKIFRGLDRPILFLKKEFVRKEMRRLSQADAE
jgi:hypothetical protein